MMHCVEECFYYTSIKIASFQEAHFRCSQTSCDIAMVGCEGKARKNWLHSSNLIKLSGMLIVFEICLVKSIRCLHMGRRGRWGAQLWCY